MDSVDDCQSCFFVSKLIFICGFHSNFFGLSWLGLCGVVRAEWRFGVLVSSGTIMPQHRKTTS